MKSNIQCACVKFECNEHYKLEDIYKDPSVEINLEDVKQIIFERILHYQRLIKAQNATSLIDETARILI